MQNIQQIFTNPLWTFIIGAIFAVIVQFIFHKISRRRRKLVYSINPTRTKVVTSGQATDLKIYYLDESLGDIDITAVQFAIWNEGNESIEKKHIPNNIVITTKPEVRILEVSNRTEPNGTKFNILDTAESKVIGKIPISWESLERNEGASIQLIYIGGTEVDILVEGLIRGQGSAKRVVTDTRFKSPELHRKTRRRQCLWLSISLLVLAVALILKSVMNLQFEIIDMFFTFSIFSSVFAIIALISTLRERFPPFGF